MAAYAQVLEIRDSKREEFRKYLEKSGLLDALTKALVSLYEEPERPPDALEYFKRNLKVEPGLVEVEALKSELADLNNKVGQLTLENKELREQVIKNGTPMDRGVGATTANPQN